MKQRDILKWAALGCALVATASAEYELARAVGYNQWVAAAVPGALDVYTVRAMRMHRDVLASVFAMILVNAASHLVTAGLVPVSVPLVVGVSAIAPLVLYRVHHISGRSEQPQPVAEVQPTVAPQPAAETAVQSQPDVQPAPQPVQPQPEGLLLDFRPSRKPHPMAHPHPHPTAPAAPAAPAPQPVRPAQPKPAAAAEDDAAYIARARKLSASAGRPPSLRALQTHLGVGQRRAQRIQQQLTEAAS